MATDYDPFGGFDLPSSVGGNEGRAKETGTSLGTSPDDGLDKLSKAELQDRAEQAGLATSGTKAELIERLRDQ